MTDNIVGKLATEATIEAREHSYPYERGERMRGKIPLAIIILLILLSHQVWAETFKGKCVGVTDGDTITVLNNKKGVKIRLEGIDCPEKSQPFGTKAKRFTSGMVYGRMVTVKVSIIDCNSEGRQAIHVAAFAGKKDIVGLLLKKGAKTTSRDGHYGETALHWAVLRGHKDVVALLIARGADVNIKDRKGRTPLQCAIEGKKKAIAELLKKHGGK